MKEFLLENLKWGRDIVDKYPNIYKDGTYGECNLRYGFEFQEGWRELVEDFSETADKLITHLNITDYPDAKITACIYKEKFGELTWQGDMKLPPLFEKLFRSYCAVLRESSKHTCEICGKPGEWGHVGPFLVKTVCEEHKQFTQ